VRYGRNKNDKSDDPVYFHKGMTLFRSIKGLTYSVSWAKEVWDMILVERG